VSEAQFERVQRLIQRGIEEGATLVAGGTGRPEGLRKGFYARPTVFAGVPKYEFYNPLGSVHGGYIAALLDSCMACAVHSTLEIGYNYATIEVKINYVRQITADTGEVHAEGKVIHLGKRIATAEGRLLDSAGKLYAHGTTTCLIFAL